MGRVIRSAISKTCYQRLKVQPCYGKNNIKSTAIYVNMAYRFIDTLVIRNAMLVKTGATYP